MQQIWLIGLMATMVRFGLTKQLPSCAALLLI
jgi:hypothetical protein